MCKNQITFVETAMTFNRKQALIFFSLFLTITFVTAQNAGTYKYIIFPTDSVQHSSVSSTMEVDSHYYISSYIEHSDKTLSFFVSVLDRDLNIIKQVLIPENSIGHLFFSNNFFYIWGGSHSKDSIRIYFAKYDKEFNLIQPPIYVYTADTLFTYIDTVYGRPPDTGNWIFSDMLMTKNNEFIHHYYEEQTHNSLFLRFDTNGQLLEEVIIPSPRDINILVGHIREGKLVETDSNYIMNFRNYMGYQDLIVFSKDSLKKYKFEEIFLYSIMEQRAAIAVGNRLIRNREAWNTRKVCTNGRPKNNYGDYTDRDIRVTFLNEDFSLKNELIFGNECLDDEREGIMCYNNPDSIYCVYRTVLGFGNFWEVGATISIACFSSEGELHFNHKLDIPDTMTYKFISNCIATSDGGVLVTGTSLDWATFSRGFLCLYHPPKNVGINQLQITNYELRVYPNPTSNQLRITNYELREDTEIQIFDIVGQSVGVYPCGRPEMAIDVSHLSSGLYFLKVDNKVVKFVKE